MKKIFIVLLFSATNFYCSESIAQNRNEASQGREGSQTNEVSDDVLLELYRGARVTDVVDGLVTVGYMDVGVMDPKIGPLWRDVETMDHRFAGIAVTVRYAPTNRPMHPGADLTKPENYQAYRDWRGMWYNELSPETFGEFIKPGTVIVMDNKDDNDTGSTGSKNILDWQEKLVAEKSNTIKIFFMFFNC